MRRGDKKARFVLLDRTAPLYDSYRVQYTSLHPDYVTVEPDGTLEWKKDPKELASLEMKTVPLISAKLTFVDGSEAAYQFTYTAYY